MKSIFIHSLSFQELYIDPQYADWYDFYLHFIIPRLDHQQLSDEYQRARFINTALIKNGKEYRFIHNLVIYSVIKNLDYQNMISLTDTLQVVEIKQDEQVNLIATLIFETLNIIARHHKSLVPADPYPKLLTLVDRNYWKTIYPTRKFTKTNFCHFISISLRNYQHLSKDNE